MTGPDPLDYGWWLASRAAGILALLCITLSVGVGLAMAGRMSPKLGRHLMAVHQHAALIGLIAIAVHGICLLGDKFLDPGLTGIAVPFVIDHAKVWTGLGVTGAWLAAILGLSYWVRTWIGPAVWRRLHRATVLVYILSVAHTLGSGTDASELWMRFLIVVTGAPILFLFVVRLLPPPARSDGFRKLRVTEVRPESAEITSFWLEPRSPFRPGQFLTVRTPAGTRSYSLSRDFRISVKRDGAVSRYLHENVRPGDRLEASGPNGAFVLDDASERPVVLLSAGVGATPVLSMLHRLAETRSPRVVWWIHGARCGREHAFRDEVRELIERLPHGHLHVRYSRPEPGDRHPAGRVTADCVERLGVPGDAEYYLCGPAPFLADLTAGLRAQGVPEDRIRSESFGPAAKPQPRVSFARSRVDVQWETGSLLELAEANSVAAPSGCRMGACHGCATNVLEGSVRHDPEPPSPPPAGRALLCCAVPQGDVVLDA